MANFRKVLQPVGALIGILLVIGGYILNGQQVASLGLPIWVWQAIGTAIFGLSILAIVLGLQRRMETENGNGVQSRDYSSKTEPLPYKYISDTYIRGQIVYLMDLLAPGAKPIILNRTIEDCEVRGPAMIVLMGTTIADSSWDGDLESLFVEIAEKRMIFGAIGLQSCVFRRCRFTAIGILGTREQIEKAKQGFTVSTSHKEVSQ